MDGRGSPKSDHVLGRPEIRKLAYPALLSRPIDEAAGRSKAFGLTIVSGKDEADHCTVNFRTALQSPSPGIAMFPTFFLAMTKMPGYQSVNMGRSRLTIACAWA